MDGFGNSLELFLQRTGKYAVFSLLQVSQSVMSCAIIFIKTVYHLYITMFRNNMSSISYPSEEKRGAWIKMTALDTAYTV